MFAGRFFASRGVGKAFPPPLGARRVGVERYGRALCARRMGAERFGTPLGIRKTNATNFCPLVSDIQNGVKFSANAKNQITNPKNTQYGR